MDAVFLNGSDASSHTFNPQFVEIVNRHVGSNALFVFEELSHVTTARAHSLKDRLEPHWDVQISVAYRPFCLWITSWHNEVQKAKIFGGKRWRRGRRDWSTVAVRGGGRRFPPVV